MGRSHTRKAKLARKKANDTEQKRRGSERAKALHRENEHRS